MSIYHRDDLHKLLTAIKQGKPCSVYLVVGDRYLCLQVADQLTETLIPDPEIRGQNVKLIDGEQEDPLNTLNQLKTYNLFTTGRQVFRVSGCQLFHSKETSKEVLWNSARKAYEKSDFRQTATFLEQLAAFARVEVAELAVLADSEWQAAFAFPKPDTAWLNEVKESGGSSRGSSSCSHDPADHYIAALEAGVPEENILLLLAETVDKRKKLYKVIQQSGVVIDLSVAEGSSKIAREEQDAVLLELVRKTLAEFGKTMEPRALPVLLECVGYHPVAVVRETEKLALYIGEASQVTMTDLMAVVGRTREEALFELTEAFADQELTKTLTIAGRLYDNGVHPLVMIAGLRNQLRKLMLVSSLRQGGPPDYVEGMTFAVFQKGYLPALKSGREVWLSQLPNHPYALYMMFAKAGKYSIKQLGETMSRLLEAEFKLKSSPLPPLLVLEHFFWHVLLPR